ncbi:hypothetical protein A2W14_06290 [Candidatus Gottesmanbacteria bacterium RBG_16_37_8]|uniref:Uncharacterized protein n=1 Tax=Candidatus Gottesmanbacteria bacterium RBG_16_37_8 TaxID=1798371 RepID=A0A1F5YWL1_9BACT|nr:MAG: hypothetical protein A2W14_06290 [Candidatus Gottesmanbacteria bacterium RBG_16_37_8]
MADQPQKYKQKEVPSDDQPTNIAKLAAITVGAILLLGVAVYAAYSYSRTKPGGIVLPGGVTYLGATPTPPVQPTQAILRFTADATVPYKEQWGVNNPFVFSYPETLPLVVFINDPTDSVGIAWGNTPPQTNILLNIELIKDRDEKMLNRPKKEFVENWWEYFTGLKGVASIQPFTNISGLKGYKAQYINQINATPNMDVFFEVPDRQDIMIHLANGILDQTIFDRIVDSVKWNPPPTPTP